MTYGNGVMARLTKRAGLLAVSATMVATATACGASAHDMANGGTDAQPSEAEASVGSVQATPTPDPLQDDQALVRTLFYNDAQASSGGLRAYAEFTAANNHPDFAYSSDECYSMFTRLGLTDAYTETSAPDVEAMAPDPTWALSPGSGRYAGMVPSGRVYILPVQRTQVDPNAGLNSTATSQVHVSVLDGRAYYFISCDR